MTLGSKVPTKLGIEFFLSKIDKCKTSSELTKNVNVLDAIHWIKKAWDETKESTIQSCFCKAGFPVERVEKKIVKEIMQFHYI